MAQFDVYRNPSARQRDLIPFMVEVQSNLLSGLPTRMTMPLAIASLLPSAMPPNLCPAINWEGQRLHLLAQMATPFLVRDLGKPLGSISERASEIVAALDAVVSGF